MSVQSEINRIIGNISAAYSKVSSKGGTIPSVQNSANLPAAIQSIPTGAAPTGSITLTANGTYNVSAYATAVVSIPVYDGSVI